ncbi:MAG: putative metal-binding motif-containing protein [Myxococcota bacterium]
MAIAARGVVLGCLVLGVVGMAGCESAPGSTVASSVKADAGSDVKAAPAPVGTECTVDSDCPAGAWCTAGDCRECDMDADCDDSVGCTQDRCEAGGDCTNTLIDGCCAADATPEELADSCGPPPTGVAPEEYWHCTESGECAVLGTMTPLAPAPMDFAGAGVASGADALPNQARVPEAGTARGTLPAPESAALVQQDWVLLMACSGCLNPGGMNRRINGSLCTSDATCLSGLCQAGFCAAWKADSDTCDWQDECTSGYCANGYCCNTACGGACDHCGLPGQEGSCGNGCQLDSWRSEVQGGAIYARSVSQDLVMLVNVGFHPGGRTVPGGGDTHVMDWGIINAEYGLCMGGPEPELCDNLDNDCDGATDEDWSNGAGILGEPCTVGAGAACEAHGYWVCPAGGTGTGPVCSAEPYGVGFEICNNIDDDCDGDIDEGVTQPCSSICGTGNETCDAGAWVDCDAPTPADFPNYDEACDGLDADLCENGTMGCVAGEGFVCIEDPLGSIAEDCSTPEDDNCNGTNNDLDAVNCVEYFTDIDGDGFGVGTSACYCAPSGDFRALEPDDCNDGDNTVYPGAPELCNGIDNDCDTIGDEREPNDAIGTTSYSGGSTTPGHPCLGASAAGGSDCNMSSCLCGPDGGGVWGCFLD